MIHRPRSLELLFSYLIYSIERQLLWIILSFFFFLCFLFWINMIIVWYSMILRLYQYIMMIFEEKWMTKSTFFLSLCLSFVVLFSPTLFMEKTHSHSSFFPLSMSLLLLSVYRFFCSAINQQEDNGKLTSEVSVFLWFSLILTRIQISFVLLLFNN